MSTEDEPAPRKSITTSASSIVKRCAGGCGATTSEAIYEDRTELDPAKRIKPVNSYPYICLECWRAGWRSSGPIDQENRYRVFNIDGRERPSV